MKFLIACLGNTGAEYSDTRHNAGFYVGDRIIADAGGNFETVHLGSVAEARHKGRTLIVLKPSTYMNASGSAIRYWLQNQRIPVENLLVVTDDIAIPFGMLRLRGKGSDGGHNGMKNIISLLNTDQFVRLRVGIGNNFERGRQIDYVLGKWLPQETLELSAILERAADIVRTFVFEGLTATMNKFNQKQLIS